MSASSFKKISPVNSLSPFVKEIMVMENDQPGSHNLSFYADGFPGIIFHETQNGLHILPQNKFMPLLFLYGQTIHPVELKMNGRYQLIIFQLYPFVIDSLFGVDPKSLNDDCYDLLQFDSADISEVLRKLTNTADVSKRIQYISDLLNTILASKSNKLDWEIRNAITNIIDLEGQVTIKKIREELHLTERTFERRFLSQVGVTPKQFALMIQFQHSLRDLKENNYSKLTDIVYKNGFADQSHFIRVFKTFTGFTPSGFAD